MSDNEFDEKENEQFYAEQERAWCGRYIARIAALESALRELVEIRKTIDRHHISTLAPYSVRLRTSDYLEFCKRATRAESVLEEQPK